MTRIRGGVIWGALALVLIVPLLAAATSPLLAWRSPIYIAAGFAGIVAMGLVLVQPLLITGALPGLAPPRARRLHRWIGAGLIAAILAHVIGLWITSPPDVIDALLFASPTPFSVWGVIAMWAAFAAAGLAALRRRIPRRIWGLGHRALALVIVAGSVVHALLIEGTMEEVTKAALAALTLLAGLRVLAPLLRRRAGSAALRRSSAPGTGSAPAARSPASPQNPPPQG